MDTAAVVRVAAVRAALQTATVMQTVTCLKIVAVMFQMTVKNKVLANCMGTISSILIIL